VEILKHFRAKGKKKSDTTTCPFKVAKQYNYEERTHKSPETQNYAPALCPEDGGSTFPRNV
jgi:hypothetical protein